MQTSTTILVLVILGSCLVSGGATFTSPRDLFKNFARMRMQLILTAFPELADEVKSGQLGSNTNNNLSNLDSLNNQQNPLQGLFGQDQRQNSFNQLQRQDQDLSNEIPRIPSFNFGQNQNGNSDSNPSPSLNRNQASPNQGSNPNPNPNSRQNVNLPDSDNEVLPNSS